LSGGAVVPDRGGQREQALADPGAEAVDAAPTVQLEIELALAGVVDSDPASYTGVLPIRACTQTFRTGLLAAERARRRTRAGNRRPGSRRTGGPGAALVLRGHPSHATGPGKHHHHGRRQPGAQRPGRLADLGYEGEPTAFVVPRKNHRGRGLTDNERTRNLLHHDHDRST